jgi:DNA polymerase (family 10)
VKGFSEKAERALLDAIVAQEIGRREMRLVDVLHVATFLLEHLRASRAVVEADLAGPVSRWDEAVSSVDQVAAGVDCERICESFLQFPYVLQSNQLAESSTSALLSGTGSGCMNQIRFVRAVLSEGRLSLNLYVCAADDFTCLRHFLTGTDSYNERLLEIAKSRGKILNAYRLSENGRTLAISSEHEFYARLSLPYVPVELRDDPANLDGALGGESYDDLVEIGDIRGMTHCHSTFSDGVASVDQMVKAVKAMNMQYITMTDHSPAAHYANGVSPQRLNDQWREIEAAQKAHGIRVFRGTESDILADGRLDYEDDVLAQLDVIIASIHARMKMDEEQMTQRLVNCMMQKQFKIWGHALGRLVLKREPIACRVAEVIEIASKSRVAIEVNGDPHRLDMQPKWLKLARRKEMKFVISTDAHSTSDLQNLKFGIHLARKAGMRRSEVLNTLSPENFRQAVKP